MNPYFYHVFLPHVFLTGISITLLLTSQASLNFAVIFSIWLLIGPIGMGTGFHRLFSHRQFITYKYIEYILAILGTIASYTPLGYFVASHNHHHKYADTDKDVTSPQRGFWHSFLWWRLKKDCLKAVDIRSYPFKQFLKDPVLKSISKNYLYIIYGYIIIVTLIFGWWGLINMYMLPIVIEHVRLNLVSSISHIENMPFSYRNHKLNDNSVNNYLFGPLSFGFAWHNNHHADQRKLYLKQNWWEFDFEGLVGTLIQKK